MMRPSLIFSAWQSIVSTVVPSRSTVIESATLASSLSLWEIRIEAMPCDLNSSSRLSNASLSLSLRLAVGSSRMSSLNFLGERLGDLDQLLLADAEIGDERVGRFFQADLLPAVRASWRRRASQSMTPICRGLVAEKDILGDRQQRNERQFLMDDDDAEMFAVGNGGEPALLALVDDFAFIGAVGIDAAEHFHQRRFAGAVLAANRVNLAAFTTRLTSRSAFTPGKLLEIPRISRIAFIANSQ